MTRAKISVFARSSELHELARHELPDGTIGIIAVSRPRRRVQGMEGWTRIDPRPWTKTAATWRRNDGLVFLRHCGHPTALRQWMLESTDGSLLRTFATLDDAIRALQP